MQQELAIAASSPHCSCICYINLTARQPHPQAILQGGCLQSSVLCLCVNGEREEGGGEGRQRGGFTGRGKHRPRRNSPVAQGSFPSTADTNSPTTADTIPLLMQMGFGEAQMLDKVLYEEEVRRLVFTFEQQFHYGVFFAYMRLREQEIRNVMWISECIAQDQKSRVNDGIVLIF